MDSDTNPPLNADALSLVNDVEAFVGAMEQKYPTLKTLIWVGLIHDPHKNEIQPMIGGGAINDGQDCSACTLERASRSMHEAMNDPRAIIQLEDDMITIRSKQGMH